MPDEKVDISPTPDPKLIQQLRKMELDAEAKKLAVEAEQRRLEIETGFLGRIIGSAKNAPNNVAFLVVALMLSAGLVVSFVYPNDRVEFWKIILPILTLTLGYLFGKNSKD